jgi:hypothetical protein
MGQQQLLLIILGVIIVGIAIAVGIAMFSSGSVQANKDAIINDMNNLAANAYQWRIRPVTMGGGGGVYTGYSIPLKLVANENASYSLDAVSANSMTIVGTSAVGYGIVHADLDSTGALGNFSGSLFTQ